MTHEDAIDGWIARSLSTCPDFGMLVRALPSVYPGDVALALRRLGRGVVPMPESELLRPSPGPMPHPADADWRFDRATCATLADEVVQRSGTGGKAMLLGCPSLYLPIRARGAHVSLIEDNEAWREWFLSACGAPLDDTSDLMAPADHDVIVADPPWYLPEYRYFLALASRLAKPHATLLMAWPPEGTRPGLDTEWNELVSIATRSGWRLVETHRLVLRYATPWYEAQALRAAGVPVLRDWRRGDLAVFNRTLQDAPDHLDCPGRPWTSARFGFVDLRLRRVEVLAAEADPRLISIVPGDIVASVSRRHPVRERVRVWTAGNRVFGCARPDLLIEFSAARTLGVTAACARVERKLDRGLASAERRWCQETWNHLTVLDEAEHRDYHAAHDAAADPSLGTAS